MTESFELAIEEHPSLTGHFPGEPIVPGAILLDHAICYIERAFGRKVFAIPLAKFIVPVRPQQTVTFTFEKTAYDCVAIIGLVSGTKVLVATMMLEGRLP
jgi:3-hydroxyacyl-[acyl-carrier-protein] dehydratase